MTLTRALGGRSSSARLLPSLAALFLLSIATAQGAETVLLEMSSPLKYHLATAAGLGTTWTAPGFVDTGWTSGTYGIGYDAGGMIKTTVPTGTLSVFTRARFNIDDPAQVESVWLGADYDDGYVAWVNGVEVRRVNLPAGALEYNTPATSHESSNGAAPTYDPIVDITAKAKPALVAGENLLAIGVWNVDAASSDLAVVPRLSINRPVAPPGEVHWTLAQSPVMVSSTLTIPLGTTLRIDPGVVVNVAANAGIDIAGQILAEGTASQKITFDRQGTTGSWSGIKIDHSGDGIVRPSTIRHAVLRNGANLVEVNATGDSEILVEDCAMDSWTNTAIHWDNGSNHARFNRCLVGMSTPAGERGHECVNGYRSSALVEYCVFGPRTGYNDQIDLGDTHWGGPVPTVQYCELYPGEDDAIDYDNCDGWIIGNFIHGHRPPANGPKESGCPQYPIGGGGVNGGGLTGNEGSRPFAVNNIIFDCYQGIGYKNGAQPTLINNTVVGCDWGVVIFKEPDISTPALAHGTLVNNLIWDCKIAVKLSWCDQDPKSIADVTHSIVPGGWPGTGNIDPAESPLASVPSKANPLREQFVLKRCAIAIDAGSSAVVSQSWNPTPPPATDAEGNPRLDLATVPDTGAGPETYYDIGAIELQGPDDCSVTPVHNFVRGDANGDNAINLADAVGILFVLFEGEPTDCQDAIDADDDGQLNLADAQRVLQFLFEGGTAIPAPFPSAGPDPTATDALADCGR